MTVLGVDVHSAIGAINWSAAKADGVSFGFARCVRSTGATDSRFTANLKDMKAAGVMPGAYGFPTSAADARQLVDLVGDPTGVLIALDIEPGGGGSDASVKTWLDTVHAAWPHHPVLVYSSKGLYAATGCSADLPSYTAAWHAGIRNGRYTSAGGSLTAQWTAPITQSLLSVSLFGGLPAASMIQYTDHAAVKGIPSPCDGNAWIGTQDQLDLLAGLTATPKPKGTDMPTLVQHAGDNVVYLITGERFVRVPDVATLEQWRAITGQAGALPIVTSAALDLLNIDTGWQLTGGVYDPANPVNTPVAKMWAEAYGAASLVHYGTATALVNQIVSAVVAALANQPGINYDQLAQDIVNHLPAIPGGITMEELTATLNATGLQVAPPANQA